MRKIITSVVDALSEDSSRKFVYVEQVFFQMWWNDQPERVRSVVRQLVAGAPLFSALIVGPSLLSPGGQLHFANGGWVMHDEACM